MATKMTTLIEQFSSVEGAWQGAPHNQAAVREPKKGNSGKGNLFVLVEAQGQTSKLEVLEKRLVALVRDTYYPAQGGITAGLRRAMQTANLWLFQQNGATGRDKEIMAGVIAVVIRDDDLFVAQAGPTALFSIMGQVVKRYPETSRWLDQVRNQATTTTIATMKDRHKMDAALGSYHYITPNINHLQLQIGDVVLLSDSRLARHLALPDLARIIQGQSVEVISQNLAQLAQTRYFSGMVIQMTAADLVKQPALRPVEERPAEAEPAASQGFNFALPNLLQKPAQVVRSEQDGDDFDFDRGLDDDHWSNTSPGGLRASPPTRILQAVVAPILSGMAFLGGGLQTILKLVLPSSQAEAPPPRKAGAKRQADTAASTASTGSTSLKQPSTAALKYVAMGLPILVLLITLLVYWYRGYNRENMYATMVSEAQQKFVQAQSAPPETAVQLLAEAEAQLGQAETIKEGQAEIDTLQADIIARRDQIGQVERLYYMPELRRYTDPGAQLSRVIVQGVHVYVLDTGLDRLYRHTLDDIGDTLLPDDGDPLLLQRGQNLSTAIVGDIVDMIWMPAAGGRQTSDLLILTREGLLEFNADWGANPITISGIDLWQSPVAVSSYFGNFYLLDNQANLIHRYRPTPDGYENPSESYFPDPTVVDLRDAVDLAIDGHIYILYRHGEIQKFLGGEPAPFQISGLDMPLNNPTAIYTAPDEEAHYLYVADAGNQRIVQLSKTGEFVRQFKPRLEDSSAFDDLRSIYIDELSEKMFVLNGGSLYAPNIPVKQP